MIDLAPDHLALVLHILRIHLPGAQVRAFGSRVSGRARPTSDLDLALKAPSPLSLATLGDLREAFEESDLPFAVDLVDWQVISPAFRAIIEANCLTLQGAEPTS